MLGRPAGRTRSTPRRRCCPGEWPLSSPLSSSPSMDEAMTEMRSVTARAGTTRVDTLTTPVSTRLNCRSAMTFPVSMYRRRYARHVCVCLVYELRLTVVLLLVTFVVWWVRYAVAKRIAVFFVTKLFFPYPLPSTFHHPKISPSLPHDSSRLRFVCEFQLIVVFLRVPACTEVTSDTVVLNYSL